MRAAWPAVILHIHSIFCPVCMRKASALRKRESVRYQHELAKSIKHKHSYLNVETEVNMPKTGLYVPLIGSRRVDIFVTSPSGEE